MLPHSQCVPGQQCSGPAQWTAGPPHWHAPPLQSPVQHSSGRSQGVAGGAQQVSRSHSVPVAQSKLAEQLSPAGMRHTPCAPSQTSGDGQGTSAEQAWSSQDEQTVGLPGVAGSRGMQTTPEYQRAS